MWYAVYEVFTLPCPMRALKKYEPHAYHIHVSHLISILQQQSSLPIIIQTVFNIIWMLHINFYKNYAFLKLCKSVLYANER